LSAIVVAGTLAIVRAKEPRAVGDGVQFGAAEQELLEVDRVALIELVRVHGDQSGGLANGRFAARRLRGR
jgi:hypothetical protein